MGDICTKQVRVSELVEMNQFRSEHGRFPTLEDIAKKLNIPKAELANAQGSKLPKPQLDGTIGLIGSQYVTVPTECHAVCFTPIPPEHKAPITARDAQRFAPKAPAIRERPPVKAPPQAVASTGPRPTTTRPATRVVTNAPAATRPTVAPAAPTTQGSKTYTVPRFQTIAGIAADTGYTPAELREANAGKFHPLQLRGTAGFPTGTEINLPDTPPSRVAQQPTQSQSADSNMPLGAAARARAGYVEPTPQDSRRNALAEKFIGSDGTIEDAFALLPEDKQSELADSLVRGANIYSNPAGQAPVAQQRPALTVSPPPPPAAVSAADPGPTKEDIYTGALLEKTALLAAALTKGPKKGGIGPDKQVTVILPNKDGNGEMRYPGHAVDVLHTLIKLAQDADLPINETAQTYIDKYTKSQAVGSKLSSPQPMAPEPKKPAQVKFTIDFKAD